MHPLFLHLANNGVRLPREPAGNSSDHDVPSVSCTYSALRVSDVFLIKVCLETWRIDPSISSAQGLIVTSSCFTILLRGKEETKARNLPDPSAAFSEVL